MSPVRAKHRLGDLVSRFGGMVLGDPDIQVSQVASLENGAAEHIGFYSGAKYKAQLRNSAIGAVILAPADRDATALPRIVSDNPYAYFARVSALFNADAAREPGVHPSALVDPSARIDPSAVVGPLSYVGKDSRIGARSVVEPGCYLGDNVAIGEDCRIYPQVSIYHDCVIGDRAILHSGAVIGADGFGFASDNGRWIKIPQIGRVIIGDDVEIGANTTVDRGALDDTVIEEGVKLDNQIQVAHNVYIGAHTAMAGCVGIAGSTRIGSHCTVGGAAMIIGHLDIADRVNISVATLITKSIDRPGTYTSTVPFAEHRAWLRNAAHLRHLNGLAERVRELEQKLNELERKES